MVKSLPYLPTKASMSVKRHISLKPRHQSQLTRIFGIAENCIIVPVPQGTTASTAQPKTPPYYSQSINDITQIILEPSNFQKESEISQRQAMYITNENLYIDIDDTALLYLPSFEKSNTHCISSNIHRLKPRPRSNQMLIFLK